MLQRALWPRILRLATNSASLLGGAVAVRASSFLIYILVARYRDAFEFGQLSLATTIFMILLELSLLGLRRVVVRHVAVQPAASRPILVHAGIVTGVASAGSLLLAVGFAFLLDYAPTTREAIVLMALALWPAALTQLAESVALGWERTHLILYVYAPVSILKVIGAWWVLERGYAVEAIVLLVVAGHVLTGLTATAVIAWKSPPGPLDVRGRRGVALVREGGAFLLTNLTGTLRTNLSTVLVSLFLNEAAVGLFNAANQLTVPLRLIYETTASSFFPSMVRRFRKGAASLREVTGLLAGVLVGVTLPLVLTIFVLADRILLLIYQEPAFAGAAIVLMITIWAPLLDALKALLGHALWAGARERIVLRVSAVNLVAALVAGLVLIPAFDLVGAAVSVVAVAAVNVVQHYVAARAALGALALGRYLWRPGVAGLAMGGTLLSTHSFGPALHLASAGLAYLLVLVGLMIAYAGGNDVARRELDVPRSD